MADNIKVWKIFVPREFYGRLAFLQNAFEETLDDQKDGLSPFTYDVFKACTKPPIVVLLSTKSNGLLLCRDILPNMKSSAEQYYGKELKVVVNEMNHVTLPCMYIAHIELTTQYMNGHLSLELTYESRTMLKELCNIVEDPAYIVYILDVTDATKSACAKEFDYLAAHQCAMDQISSLMNDLDKKLRTRILFRDQYGIIGRCSRVLEKKFSKVVEDTMGSVDGAQDSLLFEIEYWDEDECIEQMSSTLYTKSADIEFERAREVDTNRKTKRIAAILIKQMKNALFEKVKAENVSFMLQNFQFAKTVSNIRGIVHCVLSNSSADQSFLHDLMNHSSCTLIAQKFVKEFVHEAETGTRCTKEAMKKLVESHQVHLKNISDETPYEVQIDLARLKEIQSFCIRNQCFVIRVSKYAFEDASNQRHLQKEIKNILRNWKFFSDNFRLEPVKNSLKLLRGIEPGQGIGYFSNDTFKRGAIASFGHMAGYVHFVITCAHVAPPKQKIFVEDIFIGTSAKCLCIETDDEDTPGLLDFAAVEIENRIRLNPVFRHPFGKTHNVRIFEGDFSCIARDVKKLYMHRKSEENPIFFTYVGKEDYKCESSSESDENVQQGGCSLLSKGKKERVRRMDMLQPEDQRNTIRPGDSGSLISFYDADNDEVVIVFMVIGCYNDEVVCCRFYEGLQCLKLRNYPVELYDQRLHYEPITQ